MNTRPYRVVAVVVALALALGGCGGITDTVGHWFSGSGKKSKLKGTRISIMASDDSVRPDPTLGKINVLLPPPYRNADWPEPGGYADNAMYHLSAPGPLKQIWEQDAGVGSNSDSRLTASPVVAAGKIFVLDAKARVLAFDANSGEPAWRVSVAPKGHTDLSYTLSLGLFGDDKSVDATKGFGGGIAFNDGKLFATTGFGDVVALDAASGKELWRVNVGVPIFNAPVVDGGRVFVSAQDNHFHAFAASNGRELWDNQGIIESAGILESTSAAVAGEFVIVPYTSGEIFALLVQNGHPAWSDMLTRSGNVTAMSEIDDIAGRPVIDRDMVFAISHSGVMVAINLNTGDRQWSRDLGGIQTPWVAGDYIYVLTTDSQLLCLTRKEGRVKWIHQLPRWVDPTDTTSDPIVWSGPVLASDRLLLVSSGGHAESISPYTGELLGRIEIPAGAYIAPIVANDTVYILTNDATLIALR